MTEVCCQLRGRGSEVIFEGRRHKIGLCERDYDIRQKLARISARWIVLSFSFFRESSPCRCIKQLESLETMKSASVSRADAHLTSPIAVEIIGNFTAKAPPRPQQEV